MRTYTCLLRLQRDSNIHQYPNYLYCIPVVWKIRALITDTNNSKGAGGAVEICAKSPGVNVTGEGGVLGIKQSVISVGIHHTNYTTQTIRLLSCFLWWNIDATRSVNCGIIS